MKGICSQRGVFEENKLQDIAISVIQVEHIEFVPPVNFKLTSNLLPTI